MGKRELLFSVTKKDFKFFTFRSGGPGGQHQNKTESGVRLVHKDSGAVGESRNHRQQYQNKMEAFKRLRETQKWKIWFNRRVSETQSRESIDSIVEKSMQKDNLRVEGKDSRGRWEELNM